MIGNGPLPNEESKSRPAAGLRTWQFLKAIEAANLTLIKIAMPECYEVEPKFEAKSKDNGYDIFTISKNDPDLLGRIQKIIDEIEPDVVIAVNTYPSYLASKLSMRAYFWADLNGWIMAEGAIQAYATGSNDYLPHYYRMEKSILQRADKISTVSVAQKGAALGELAFLGRINKNTAMYEFVEHVPNVAYGCEKNVIESEEIAAKIPKDAFLCLWAGGYNTWADEVTLFKGMEFAMREKENVYFVSTGGEISGLENKTFANFKKLVEESEFRKRFVFLGWVETKFMPFVYEMADLGLNVDLNCIETHMGARNRINEMMKYGLPIVTTLGSEIAGEVAACGAGIGVKSGDFEALGRAIVGAAAGDAAILEKTRDAGIAYTKENDYGKIMNVLNEWLKKPGHAPDHGKKLELEGVRAYFSSAWRYLKQKGLKKFLSRIFR